MTIKEQTPKSISKASKMIYISAIVGILNPLIMEVTTGQKVLSDPIILKFLLAITGFTVLLGYLVGLGKRWSRIVLIVIFLLSLIPFPKIIEDSFNTSMLIGVLSLGQVLLFAYAVYLLFTSESRKWYRNTVVK
ncbi:hypothetical protein [Aureisphaera sp.]